MENTTSFKEWLVNAYHNQAAAYRAALDMEVRNTIAIYGYPLPKDVRPKLLASLKEIEFPPLAKYDGIKDGNEMKIFNTTPKPNKVLLLRSVIEDNKI